MLVPVQTLGEKPPLFLIHGLIGLVTMGPFLAQVLGPDQPLYVINANGLDGRETVAGNIKDMVLTYVEEIVGVQPSGPLLIGGMCTGAVVAIEVVRELQARGCELGPLILADPPGVVPGYIKQNQRADPRDPLVAQQLYQWVRGQLLSDASRGHVPFQADNERQLHAATLAGINSLLALARHVPEIFSGPVTVILSFERAARFFHPEMHWVKLLPPKPTAHVLPYTHDEIFQSGRHEFARVLKFVLEGAMKSKTRVESAALPAFASA